ncbi:MAG: radical SAM family heme chaperone HemW [Chthoniobacterales bacterium]|nr:radical SAM family heme chaperone HemW [Chthoniobacterales bacterium]
MGGVSARCKHLYVHIPFCPKICPYCNFYKEGANRWKIPKFLDALILESRKIAHLVELETVFVGGGTPTALSSPQIQKLFLVFKQYLDFSKVSEWTIEINPATVSLEKARLLLELGVNRASLGVQSWDSSQLLTLGRVHTIFQAERSYNILRDAGFKNINIDLIFGIPGQTLKSWEKTLEKTCSLKPEHISAYALTYEEDTEFFFKLKNGIVQRDEDLEVRMFHLTQQYLEAAGYVGYEISNFAKEGFESKHNWAYWNGDEFLGLGPSAFSNFMGHRWQNIENTEEYTNRVHAGIDPKNFDEIVDYEIKLREKIAFGLRTRVGVPKFYLDEQKSGPLIEEGYLEVFGENVKLSQLGKILADEIAAELIP